MCYYYNYGPIPRYATVYTMAPVFSLVLDEDVSPDIALMYPELYRDLMKVCRPPAPIRNSFHKQEEYEKESDAYTVQVM